MKIEEAIKQKKPFRNEHHKALANIIHTYGWLMECLKKELKPFDITIQQYNVLRILKGAGEPISTSEIRQRLLDKMSDSSRMVERLCKKGWINKQACCHDKRLVDVSLSEEGLKMLDSMQICEGRFDQIMKNLTSEDAALLNNLLEKIRE